MQVEKKFRIAKYRNVSFTDPLKYRKGKAEEFNMLS
jgi:hypothetical protein